MKRLLFAAAACAVAIGCGPVRPPVVNPKPPQTPPEAYEKDCRTLYKDELGRDPVPDDPMGLKVCEDRLAARKADGVTPVETQEDFRAFLNSTPEGIAYDEAQREVILPRLVRASGKFFKLDNGQPISIREHTEFQLLRVLLEEGEGNADALLKRNAEASFNMVRVLGMFNNPRVGTSPQGGMGRFIPSEHPDYWAGVRKLCKMAAKRGLYVEFTVFADVTVILPTVDAQLAHWANIQPLSDLTNLLVEAVNENDQTINTLVSIGLLPRPQGMMVSHGSNGSDKWPVAPYWDYVTFHVSSSEWQRKTGHNGWEIDFAGPVLTNETARYPDREGQPYHAEDQAAGAFVFVGGTNHHDGAGKYGEPWNNLETEAVAAFMQGAFKYPFTCQVTGPYRHDEFIPQETAEGLLRIYLMGYDTSCLVKIRK